MTPRRVLDAGLADALIRLHTIPNGSSPRRLRDAVVGDMAIEQRHLDSAVTWPPMLVCRPLFGWGGPVRWHWVRWDRERHRAVYAALLRMARDYGGVTLHMSGEVSRP